MGLQELLRHSQPDSALNPLYRRSRKDISSVQDQNIISATLRLAAKGHKDGQKFLDAYEHLSTRPKANLQIVFDLFIKLPSSVDKTIESKPFPGNDASLSHWLEWVHHISSIGAHESFMVCSFTTKNPKSNASLAYKLSMTTFSHIKWLQEVPRRALAYLLSQENSWGLSESLVTTLLDAQEPQSCDHAIKLPSEKRQDSRHTSISLEPISFSLRWQSNAPKYKGDLDTYVWQRFRKPPPFIYVRIFVLNRDVPQNLRALLVFESIRSLEEFKSLHHNTLPSYQLCSDRVLPHIALIDTFKAAYGVVLSDTIEFLKESTKQLTNLAFTSRAHPRTEKIHYLIHLNDCRKRAQLDMKSDLGELDQIIECIRTLAPPGSSSVDDSKDLYLLRDDLKYLLAELEDQGRPIDELKSEIESQNALKSRNTSLLTFFAAVYVPLAFVTSFLGMNISPTNIPLSNNFTLASGSNDSPGNSPGNSPANSPLLWDMAWFGILAGPLLFVTIILPLIAGPVIQWTLQSYILLQDFWRLSLFVFGIIYVVLYYAVFESTVIRYNVGFSSAFCLGIANDCALLLVASYEVYSAFQRRKRRTWWVLFLVFSTICTALDFFFEFYGFDELAFSDLIFSQHQYLFGGLPWTLLLLVLAWAYMRTWVADIKLKYASRK